MVSGLRDPYKGIKLSDLEYIVTDEEREVMLEAGRKVKTPQVNHPRCIEIGTLSCYFNIDELMQISEALWIARDDYGKTDWSEIMEYEDYLHLQERVSGYIKEYQRRNK